MSIFVIGINHASASIDVREKIYFAKELLALYLQDLISRHLAREAVLLSTCNRSELYCEGDDPEALLTWFCTQTILDEATLRPLLYLYKDEKAVAHIMEVACGLDSMVLGEPQILGQVKEAFAESCTAGAVNASFHRLFQQVFAVAKDIRTTTAIGACPVSVASAALHFAKKILGEIAEVKVALIGAGDMSELLLRYFKTQLLYPVKLLNRSFEKAETLAKEFNASAHELSDLAKVLEEVDLVFSSTGSPHPLLTKALMTEIMKKRKNKPLTLIDLAVPRDIDPSVLELTGVNLYCIDDLKVIIKMHQQGREHAALKAKEMIRQKSIAYLNEEHSHEKVMYTIRAYRGQIEEICRQELNKAKQQLQQGVNSNEVLEAFANAFTKKLLHVPSVQLRLAGAEGRFELLSFAKQLFAIPDKEAERA